MVMRLYDVALKWFFKQILCSLRTSSGIIITTVKKMAVVLSTNSNPHFVYIIFSQWNLKEEIAGRYVKQLLTKPDEHVQYQLLVESKLNLNCTFKNVTTYGFNFPQQIVSNYITF